MTSPRQNRNEPQLTELLLGLADAYKGISNGTLSVKADFNVNGLGAGAELTGLGAFTGPGIFRIPLAPPITTLPPSHLTVTVLDGQGNRTTVKVRFWVAPPTFRIVSLSEHLQESRLTVRFENPDAVTGHSVRWTDNIRALSPWSPLPVLDWESESNRVHRIDVHPPNSPAGLLRVLRP